MPPMCRQPVDPVHGIPSPHAVRIQNLRALPSIGNDGVIVCLLCCQAEQGCL